RVGATLTPPPAEGGALRSQDLQTTPDWTFCADEGEVCAFAGTAEVRYGVDGAYAPGTFTDGVECSNAVFGDPAFGVVKHCDFRRSDPTCLDRRLLRRN